MNIEGPLNRRQVLAGSMMFAMLERLDANKDKSDGWIGDDGLELMDRLEEEVGELREVVERGPRVNSGQTGLIDWRTQVRREAADVANFAAMIADNMSCLVPNSWED